MNGTLGVTSIKSEGSVRVQNTSVYTSIGIFGTNIPRIDMGDTVGDYTRTIALRVRASGITGTQTTIRNWLFNNTGTCNNALNTTTWNVQNDHRIKENIKKTDLNKCFDNVKNINMYRYNYINGFKSGGTQDKTQLGFITQQVKPHFPKSVVREKIRFDDNREIPDLTSINIDQVNFTLFGAVKQLIKVIEKQSKCIKKLEEMLNIIDDDEVEDDTDEPYIKIEFDEVNIDEIEPSEPTEI